MAQDRHTHAQQQSVRLKTMQKVHIFYMCQMKGPEASITFHKKTWHQAGLIVMVLALKKAIKKTYFLHYDI